MATAMATCDYTVAFVGISHFVETKPAAACFDDVAVGQIAYSVYRFSVDKNSDRRAASDYVPSATVCVGLYLGNHRVEGRGAVR